MFHPSKPSEESRDSFCAKSAILPNLTLKESPFSTNKENPFRENFVDPLCKLNLKETSEFVRAFPMTDSSAERRRSSVGHRRCEAPSTPGRPVFNFSVGNHSRKGFPSKWDDAEKWLISSSCNESPAHATRPCEASKFSRQNSGFNKKGEDFEEKMARFNGYVVSKRNCNWGYNGIQSEVFLKGIMEPSLPNFQYSEPTKDGFLFNSSFCEALKDAANESVKEVHHRDIGTEMTPLASSTTTRCHTPIKSSSPARHNTPANSSGPLMASNYCINVSELKDCHFAKLDLGAQFDSEAAKWSSREEEEEEISKSLRPLEMDGGRKSIEECRAAMVWEDKERTKSCIRYQREEARIQAWVNLQKAKSEAQSRKLEMNKKRWLGNLRRLMLNKATFEEV